jgi:hypothetical protein
MIIYELVVCAALLGGGTTDCAVDARYSDAAGNFVKCVNRAEAIRHDKRFRAYCRVTYSRRAQEVK